MSLTIKGFKRYAKHIRVTDGAWGTQLHQLGLPPGSAPELWNVENPGVVERVARSYADAGSDLILTNTFGGNRFVLSRHGAGWRVAELVEAGTAISRKAAGRSVKVFGSLGPSGKVFMMGEVTEGELVEAFSESAAAIERGGADGLVLETFNEMEEIEIAMKAARSACKLPVVACMTFASGPDGTATIMGNRPADLVRVAGSAGASAVGANCGCGPENYVRVARMLSEAGSLPVWIKPNAGVPAVRDGRTVFPMGPEEFAGFAVRLVEAGARFLGGCCGTTPAHIVALRSAVKKL